MLRKMIGYGSFNNRMKTYKRNILGSLGCMTSLGLSAVSIIRESIRQMNRCCS